MYKGRSANCLRACTYTIGGLQLALAVLSATLAALGLSTTLLAIPALNSLPGFTICFHQPQQGHVQDQEGFQAVGMSTSSPGCTSSTDITRKLEDGTALNVLTFAFSVAMFFGVLKICFVSVLLHGVTSLQTKLVKIFCIYYAVFIGLGSIGTTILCIVFGFTPVIISNCICLLLDVLCLLVINR